MLNVSISWKLIYDFNALSKRIIRGLSVAIYSPYLNLSHRICTNPTDMPQLSGLGPGCQSPGQQHHCPYGHVTVLIYNLQQASMFICEDWSNGNDRSRDTIYYTTFELWRSYIGLYVFFRCMLHNCTFSFNEIIQNNHGACIEKIRIGLYTIFIVQTW